MTKRVYFWRLDLSGGQAPRQVAECEVRDDDLVLITSHDPALQEALVTLKAAPTLPVSSERMSGGNLELTMTQVSPGDPGYWMALGDAITLKTGLVMTSTPSPPFFF